MSALDQEAASRAQGTANSHIGRALMIGGGTGMALAGADGLAGIVRKNLAPVRKKKRDKSDFVYPLKTASDDLIPDPMGGKATVASGVPYYVPGVALGGLLAGAGAYGVTRASIKHQAKKDQEAEIGQARKEFQQAMLRQYERPKLASDETFATLCGLFDTFVKCGEELSDTTGKVLGVGATVAGLAALTSGAVVYEKAKKRRQAEIMQDAMRKHEQSKYRLTSGITGVTPVGVGP